jgi:DNA polymerase-3 subunit epsilon
MADTVVVLDFETTGFSPNAGDRPIEAGALLIEGGKKTVHFQQLMNPGFAVHPNIENITGITNKMLRKAPPCEEAMAAFADFIGDHNLVAHNAAFDRRFLDAEMRRLSRRYRGAFACTMQAARKIYPAAPCHKLEALAVYKKLPPRGDYHRALADAEVTADLWLGMLKDLGKKRRETSVTFAQMRALAGI